jgi:hypothetical protein
MQYFRSLLHVRKILFVVLFLAAPFSILYLIQNYGLTIPFWDQWSFVHLLEKSRYGQLSLSDLWAQHAEHRIFFPRLVMLALASMTNWKIIYELYTNFIFASLTMLFLYFLLRYSLDDTVPSWLLVVFSLVIFSPAEYENWAWGWQIPIFLSTLATTVTVWTLVRWPDQLKGILLAIMSAVIASYSFNNGLITWVIGGAMLMLRQERKWTYIILWSSAFIATLALYYHGYAKLGYRPLLSMHHPYDFAQYVLAYIGAPLAFHNKYIAIIMGLFLLIATSILSVIIYRIDKEEFNKVIPWIALALYSLLSGIATGMGRLRFGIDQSLSSRYVTISLFLILSTLAVAAIFIKNHLRPGKHFFLKWGVATSLVSFLLFCYGMSFLVGVRLMVDRYEQVAVASLCLEDPQFASDDCLRLLNPDPVKVRECINILRRMGITFSVQ